jgi:hypothetical protein
MLSLSSATVSHVAPEIVSGTAPDGQYETARVNVRMRPGMAAEAARQDLAVLGPILRPADKNAVAPIVARLRVRTKSRATDPAMARFAAETMIGDLAAYPLDVVEKVCEEWPTLGETGTWFPAWAELYPRCERLAQPRRSLANALRWVAGGSPADASRFGAIDNGDPLAPAARPVGARNDPRPKDMLERHSRISRRRIGMFGAMPDDTGAWWSQILQAATAEGIDPGSFEDWRSPAPAASPPRPVGASEPKPPAPPPGPSDRRMAELAKAWHADAQKPAESPGNERNMIDK